MAKKQTRQEMELATMQSLIAEPGEEMSDEETAALAGEEAVPEPIEDPEPVVVDPEEPKEVKADVPVPTEPEIKDPKAPEGDEGEEDGRLNKRVRQLVEERKAAEKEAQELRERFARVDERQKYIQEQRDAEARVEEARLQQQRRLQERPDETIDPQGAQIWDLKEQVKQESAQRAALQQQVEARFNQSTVDNDVARFQQALNSDIVAAKIKNPDYMEAATYATQERAKIWAQLGYTPEQALELVNQEALAIAKRAIDVGQSPTDIYYGLAKQWGFKGNGGAPAATSPQAKTQEKLQQIAAGSKATGFGPTPNVQDSEEGVDIRNMTALDIGKMSEERFTYLSNHPDKRIKQAFWNRVQTLELGD